MTREITNEDRRRFNERAYQMGYDRPDAPNPYRKGTPSYRAWRRGKDDRIMNDSAAKLMRSAW